MESLVVLAVDIMKKMFDNAFSGKKVLVTGHTGFKGSWLTAWLNELGAEILGYSLNPPTNPNMYDVLGLENDIHSVTGDIRNIEKLVGVFKDFNPEIVFHLAAQPIVRLSYHDPILTYSTNVIGTVNVLEAVRLTESVHAVLNVTSDKCYENQEWLYGYREIDPMGGYDPYSSSKGCSELVTSAYRNSFFNIESYGKVHNVAVSTARAGNVIGGGDWAPDRLMPDCVRSLSMQKEIIIRNPKSTRPWQHVLEPLSGYLLLVSKMLEDGKIFSGAWNFGPHNNDIIDVESVVRKLIEYWDSGHYLIKQDNKLHEANLLKLDISKSDIILGWRPVFNIEDAIKKTAEWYKFFYSNEKKSDIYSYTISQIREYCESACSLRLPWAS